MRIRFDPAAVNLDLGHQILWPGNDWDGMAEITFEAYGLVVRVKVFTVMTAETSG
jgi:hypothetical protein